MYYDILFWIIYGLALPDMLHIMQQESYQNDGMYRWILKNPKKAFKPGFIGMVIVVLAFLLFSAIVMLITKFANIDESFLWLAKVPATASVIALFIYNIVLFIKTHKERKNAKKSLVYTARIKRLMAYNMLVVVLLELFFIQTFNFDNASLDSYAAFIYAFLILTIPVNMIIANWFASPLEKAIGEHYIKNAYKKLNSKEFDHLIKIGITGSYGKTSTKYILKTILSEKYNVLATPGSYNTTMGNVRIIREQLKPEHEVFISEMGARKRYDIKEICDFVKPHIGIITSIGPQHLETFKSIENVAKTKGELLQGVKNNNEVQYSQYDTTFSLMSSMFNSMIHRKETKERKENEPEIIQDGAVFLPKDGSYCEELYRRDTHSNKFLFAVEDREADIYATNIEVTKEGSSFIVVSRNLGKYTCQTKLLGEHNVQNVISAIAVAEYLGLSKEQIIEGCKKIEPVEHRLQIFPSTNGTTVIDDAFNSNPAGSKAALDVISKFDGRKIIITPGMVELGEEEDNLNKEFGKQMASVVDIAILVGPKHTKPIQDGLKENGFDEMNLYVVSNLDEATQRLAKVTKVGDVILFENDLPDSYNE